MTGSGARKPSFYAVRRRPLPLAVAIARSASGPVFEPHAGGSMGGPERRADAGGARLVVRAFALTGDARCFATNRRCAHAQVTESGLQGGCRLAPAVVGAQLFGAETLLARACCDRSRSASDRWPITEITVEQLRPTSRRRGPETLRARPPASQSRAAQRRTRCAFQR